ncbi:aminotransferase class III-fold pyridoxal phosphate-dependent enzyme [Embleya scabrispora]|uniref:aminotransferase class III-fold pyridoxal phosphate-dependent enzyme n=1 Tax=Embleya scabrispora TaxID=159449 RepID=UPI001F358F56|nr:aminotransferase class III-fold pyridoxal phosphate-dependent enzyme [Embleya scabrispora]
MLSAESTETSRALFHRARRSLAGGTTSSGRIITTGSYPYPLYIAHGKAAHIWDVDGNEYVDYLNSYGCAVMGHADPRIASAVAEVSAGGTMFGAGTIPEIELAETMRAMIPCADLVRFADSGSEAIQGAIRSARGLTSTRPVRRAGSSRRRSPTRTWPPPAPPWTRRSCCSPVCERQPFGCSGGGRVSYARVGRRAAGAMTSLT